MFLYKYHSIFDSRGWFVDSGAPELQWENDCGQKCLQFPIDFHHQKWRCRCDHSWRNVLEFLRLTTKNTHVLYTFTGASFAHAQKAPIFATHTLVTMRMHILKNSLLLATNLPVATRLRSYLLLRILLILIPALIIWLILSLVRAL